MSATKDSPSPPTVLDDLAETRDLFDVLDAALIGYAVTDGDGRVLYASEPYKRIAAVTEERLATGAPWYDLDLAGPEEKAMRGAIWRAFRTGEDIWNGWVRWHLPSGRVRFFEGTAKPLPGGRVLMIANDRSDRIEADRALEESEEALLVILNDLPVNVSLISPDGIMLYINQVLPNRLGVGVDAIVGRQFDAVTGIRPDPLFSARLRRAIEEERRIDGVNVHLTRGTLAGTHWLFFGRPLYARDGKMQRYMTVSVERTAERKLAEERGRFAAALAENQKISALNDFAGSLAHELANVLQPVGVYARRLARDPGAPDVGEHAVKIDKAVRDAGRILRRTLTMARSDVHAPRQVDIAALTKEVVENARDLAPKALTYDADLPDEAVGLCQPTELRQVLLNLLNNAAEAQHYKGRIRIAIRPPAPVPSGLIIAPTAPGPYWRLAVEDEGDGMTDAVRAKVFEPFFTTKAAGRGTGLGLPVVLGLVTGWGGTVTVDSRVTEGSTFTVWIPQSAMTTREGATSEEA